MDPLHENILTYITETCLDPKIWGLLMCTSKYFYNNLIERFLTTKFMCMVVNEPSIDCLTYRTDTIFEIYDENGIMILPRTLLTTNPFIIKAHALMNHVGIFEVIGFYIRYLKITNGGNHIEFEGVISGLLNSSFFDRLTPTIRTQLDLAKELKLITLKESANLTRELIDMHYWHHSKLKGNDPNYNKDLETLNREIYAVGAWCSFELLNNLSFDFEDNIPECVCCGMCHPKKVD